MINFKTIDVEFFGIEIDGLPLRTYPKIYQAKITSADRVILYNTQTEKELYNSLRFNEFSVNGVVSANANAAQVLLNALVFNDGTGGVDFQPQIDSLQTQINDLADLDLISGSVVANNLVLTLNNGSIITIDATAFTADVRVTSGVYNSATQALDFTLSNSTIISVPVSSLLPVVTDATLSGNGSNVPLKVEISSNPNNNLTLGTDGKLLVNHSLPNTIIFNANGTYTPTAGMKYVEIEAVGGGAAGGGVSAQIANTGAIAPSGQGGSYLKIRLTAAQIGLSKPIVIGLGGIGQALTTNANPGGTTQMNGIFSVPGGLGAGFASSYTTPFINGLLNGAPSINSVVPIITTGTVLISRFSEQPGSSIMCGNNTFIGYLIGNGGNTPLGAGAKAPNYSNISRTGLANIGGITAVQAGGGGTGAFVYGAGSIARAGGNGANGTMIITEYF